MKNYFVILFLLLNSTLSAQTKTIQDIFNPAEPITWFGIDFSQAKIIGDEGRLDTEDAVHDFMYSINTLMLSEQDKYDMAGALHRDAVRNAITITTNKNKTLNGMSLRILDKDVLEPLPKAALSDIIHSYDFGNYEGIGVMFMIDRFSKYSMKGTMWVTFFDIKTKTVLLADHFARGPVGFGVRNYWAYTIYGTIRAIKHEAYKHWRKKNKARV